MANVCVRFFRGILYPKGSSPLKWKGISVLFLSLFSTAVSITLLFPFLPAMVKHFGKTEEEAGYYAGLIASSMFFGRFFSSYFWGLLADKIGRRPVIIISVTCLAISTFLFGLSTSVAMAIGTRLMVGLTNGVIGTSKAIISELCDETNQSLGMSTVTSAFTTGLILGPAMGGFLSEAGTKYPNVFPKGSFFYRYPFMLPCFINSILLIITAVIAYKWLPETLKRRKTTNDDKKLLVNGLTMQHERDKNSKRPTQDSHGSENVNDSELGDSRISKPNETQNTTNGGQESSNNEPDDTEHVLLDEPQHGSKEITRLKEDVQDDESKDAKVSGEKSVNIEDIDEEDQESTRKSLDKELDGQIVVTYECTDGSTVHFETVQENSDKEHSETRQRLWCCSWLTSGEKESNLRRILRNRDAVLVLSYYSLFSFATLGFDELTNLWAATSPRLGGLGFNTDQIGTFHLIVGILLTIIQPTVLPKVERKLGCLLNLQVVTIIAMFLGVLTPTFRIFYNRPNILWPVLLIFLAAKRIAVTSGFLATFLLLNNSVSSDLLCSINGLGLALASLIKSFGPTVGGSLFAWSISSGRKIGFPFNINLAFIVLGFFLVLTVITSCFVSESLNHSKESKQELVRKSMENLAEAEKT